MFSLSILHSAHALFTVVFPYSISVAGEFSPLAKHIFFQKFDYTPHMGDWLIFFFFFCHVPSFQWQVINAALTKHGPLRCTDTMAWLCAYCCWKVKGFIRCHIYWFIFCNTAWCHLYGNHIWTQVFECDSSGWFHVFALPFWSKCGSIAADVGGIIAQKDASSSDASPRPPTLKWKMKWIILLMIEPLMTC